jgi:hypothetical protein
MRAAIGVERAKQALLADHLQERLEARHRAFLGHEERRVDLARGVVQGDNQIPLLVRHPIMPRAVLVQHHPRQRLALALLAVRATPVARLDLAGILQYPLGPGVAEAEPMIAHQLLVEVLHVEVEVPRRVELDHPRHHIRRNPAA